MSRWLASLFVLSLGCSSDPASKHVFTTSLSYKGGFGGLAAGDELCNTAGVASNLGGAFKAWLSDSTADAIDRIDDVGPWLRTDGEVAFNNKTNLKTLPIVVLNLDENGAAVSGEPYVFTGTGIGGVKGATNCSDWTTSAPTDSGTSGQFYSNDPQFWTGAGTHGCDMAAHLYCVEQ